VVECLPSKQVVTGSSPASRSKPLLTTCPRLTSLNVQLARYRLDARAGGFSEGFGENIVKMSPGSAFCWNVR
jgi:hypothetical protein